MIIIKQKKSFDKSPAPDKKQSLQGRRFGGIY